MLIATKVTFDLTIPNEPFIAAGFEAQLSTSPCWFLCHLGEEIVIDTLQEPPGLLMPCATVHPRKQTRVIQLLAKRSLEEDLSEMTLKNLCL